MSDPSLRKDFGGVYIPPEQAYAEVQKLSRQVDQIDGKIDRILDETRQIKRDLSDHEARLRSLEIGETERQKRVITRLDALEAGRLPMKHLAAAAAIVMAVPSVAAFITR